MATISKFYLLDAASPNTGTLPTDSPATRSTSLGAVTGDAVGATTNRDATDVPGTSNPDVESTLTSNADTLTQVWGHRRFMSRPLAARTFSADGNWTFSYARSESNLNHNQLIFVSIGIWTPSTGLWNTTHDAAGRWVQIIAATEPLVAGAEETESLTAATPGTVVVMQDNDILVFEVYTQFQQAMGTAYTEQFAYDGTTEASTTTCASFITPPVALTLIDTVVPSPASAGFQGHRHRLPDGS